MKPLSLNAPHLIIMTGIPGSGKTFFAERFAETFKAPFVSFERIQKEMFPKPTYSPEEQAKVNVLVEYMLEELFKSNQTIIYEGPTHTKASRLTIARYAIDHKYSPLLVWVQTESATSKTRATKKVRDVQSMTAERFDLIISKYHAPGDTERPVVISGKHTYASQLKIILSRLIKPGQAEDSNLQKPERSTQGRQITIR